jgi:hypothetical protein
MSSLSIKSTPKINTLSGKVRWKGIDKTTREFFRPGKQDSSAKILAKEFQRAGINKSRRIKGQEIVQNMIIEGRVTKNKAKRLMNDLGYTGSENKRYKEFKDISECKATQKKQDRMQAAKKEFYASRNKKTKSTSNKRIGASEKKTRIGAPIMSPSLKIISNRTAMPETAQPSEKKKISSVWEIINKQKHSDIFPANDQKAT